MLARVAVSPPANKPKLLDLA